MNVKYDKGEIKFDLHDILQSVSGEDKLAMMESFACDDDIIKHVADQIISKWTENYCSGGTAFPASAEPRFGLDWACREVAKKSGEVAAREIERLEKAVAYHQEGERKAWEANYELRRELRIYRP